MSVSPQAQARLQELHDRDGVLTPDAVIADAKDPNSPLHDQFVWDVHEAAMQHWRATARRIISSVRIVIKTEKYSLSSVAYVRDPDKEGREQGYASVAGLRSDKDRARKALRSELMRADAAMHRAYDVASSLGLDREIEAIRAQIAGLQRAA